MVFSNGNLKARGCLNTSLLTVQAAALPLTSTEAILGSLEIPFKPQKEAVKIMGGGFPRRK